VSAELLAEHFQQISDISQYSVPESLSDEFALIEQTLGH